MAEATAKPIMPTMKTHLRPTTSAMRPPISSSEPKASAYAVTIHCRALSENARSVWAVGSAMFTIVASSTTISCAMPRTARIHQRLVLLAAPEDVVADVFSRVVVMWLSYDEDFPEPGTPFHPSPYPRSGACHSTSLSARPQSS